MLVMKQELLDVGFEESEVIVVGYFDGMYVEWYWKWEFLVVYEWLFVNVIIEVYESVLGFMKGVEVFFNFGGDMVYIILLEEMLGFQCWVFIVEGKLVRFIQFDGWRMSFVGLLFVVYLIGFYLKSG